MTGTQQPHFERRGLFKLFAVLAGAAVSGAAEGAALASVRSKPVLVLSSTIAGVAYAAYAEQFRTLKADTPLVLRREPDNLHDPRAILILNKATGHKIGYVPRRHNKVITTLMDQGVRLEALLTEEPGSSPYEVAFSIYLSANPDALGDFA